jgi:phosphate transport system substrate-binding protein
MHIVISRLLKGRRRALTVGVGALVALGLAACDYGPDNDKDTLTIVGSDTTQDVMAGLKADYDADLEYNNNEDTPEDDRDTLVNVLSQQTSPLTAPPDEDCPNDEPAGGPAGITWGTPAPTGGRLAPNGSGAGRDALKASVLAGDGCVDIARSSAAPRPVGTGAGQDPSSFRYYAFALDAVGWSSASTLAPSNLTLAQLRGIYNCTFTNWNQVGGQNGAIQRYWPQAGSGTRSFAQSDLLGFDPTTFSGPSCPAVILAQENSGQGIAANGHQQSAAYVYSGANWVAQVRGTAPDQRAGQTIRNLNGQNIIRGSGASSQLNARDDANPTAPVWEGNVTLIDSTPSYPGIRYVWNVISTASDSYASATRYVGFDNVQDGATSPLCSGSLGTTATIQDYGFGRLTNASDPVHNVPGSLCREWIPS